MNEPERVYSIRATIHDVLNAAVCARCCSARPRNAFTEWVHHHYRWRINSTKTRRYIFHSMPHSVFFSFCGETGKAFRSQFREPTHITITTHSNAIVEIRDNERTQMCTESKSDLYFRLFWFHLRLIQTPNWRKKTKRLTKFCLCRN